MTITLEVKLLESQANWAKIVHFLSVVHFLDCVIFFVTVYTLPQKITFFIKIYDYQNENIV